MKKEVKNSITFLVEERENGEIFCDYKVTGEIKPQVSLWMITALVVKMGDFANVVARIYAEKAYREKHK